MPPSFHVPPPPPPPPPLFLQAIGLLDDLDKELNTYAMRVREWYGWHFPEMTKIVTDNIAYAKTGGWGGMGGTAARRSWPAALRQACAAAVRPQRPPTTTPPPPLQSS